MKKQVLNKYVSEDRVSFTIVKSSSSMKVEFDTENYVSEEIMFNDTKYVYCKGNSGVDNLIWTKNDYVYRISGMLTFNDFIKIAETIE